MNESPTPIEELDREIIVAIAELAFWLPLW